MMNEVMTVDENPTAKTSMHLRGGQSKFARVGMNDTGSPDEVILTEESTSDTVVATLRVDFDGTEHNRQVISSKRRYVALFLCFIDSFLLGGAFFGWAALVYVFVKDGLYSHLSPEAPKSNNTMSVTSLPNGSSQYQTSEEHPTCDAQDKMLSLAFTFGMTTFGLIAFPAGVFFDRFGLMPTRLIASALGSTALLCLAFASKDLPWLIYPGCILLAPATFLLILTNSHVSSLAGRHTSLVLSFYSAGINTSGTMFLIIKLLYDAGIPHVYSLSCHSSAWLLVIFVTIVLLPKHKVLPPVCNETVAPSSIQGRKKKTFKQCIFSPLFIIFVYWLTAYNVSLGTYFAIFYPRVNKLVHGDTEKVSHFTNMLSYAQASSILLAPIAGLLMDSARSSIRKRGVRGVQCAIEFIWPISLSALLVFLWNLMNILMDEIAMYISVFLTECVRNALYPTAFGFLELMWPPEYYGSLFGLAYLISGVGTMMQYPYIIWMQKYGTFPLDLFFLVISVTAAVFPIYIVASHFWRRGRAAETTVMMSARI